MNRPTSALYVCGIILFLAIVHMLHYIPQSPERMAVHFDISGNADGWSHKTGFYILYAVLLVAMSALFVVLAFLIPRFGSNSINIPHRRFWLAEDRRAETYEYLSATIIWMGNLTLVFIIAMMHLTIAANIGGEPKLGSGFWWMLTAFILLILGLSARMVMRFYRLPAGGMERDGSRIPMTGTRS
jgi:uncharacterized membrane protein